MYTHTLTSLPWLGQSGAVLARIFSIAACFTALTSRCAVGTETTGYTHASAMPPYFLKYHHSNIKIMPDTKLDVPVNAT